MAGRKAACIRRSAVRCEVGTKRSVPPNLLTLFNAMTLSIPSAVVSMSDRGASVLFLGGSLWIRKDSCPPTLQTGTYDLVLNVGLQSVNTQFGSRPAVQVLGVASANKSK